MTDKNAPHKAVISISCHVHEMEQDGHCSTRLVDLSQHDILSDFLLSLDGNDLEECLLKVKEWIKKLN